MAFKINISNKPQPIPNAPLFKEIQLSKKRTIWLSLPQIDKLSVSVPITKHLFGTGVNKDTPVAVFANELGYYFKNIQEVAECENAYLFKDGWKYAIFKLGAAASSVRFALKKDKGNFSLLMECNPRKLGPKGFSELKDILGSEVCLTEFVEHGKVNRIDFAVDIVNLHVSDIVIRHEKQGKRAYYVAADGRLESVYLYRIRKAPKPKYDEQGNLKPIELRSRSALVKVYDKVREQLDRGLPRPYGKADVTRVEVTVSRAQKKLMDLDKMTNPFLKLRAGYVGNQSHASHFSTEVYLAVRRTLNRIEARNILGHQLVPDMKDQAEDVPIADLLSTDTWQGFSTAMEMCGLASFVTADFES